MWSDEFSRRQDIQVKGTGRAREMQPASNLACGKAPRRMSHEQSKDIKPRLLRERGERIDGKR